VAALALQEDLRTALRVGPRQFCRNGVKFGYGQRLTAHQQACNSGKESHWRTQKCHR
jgi:hypothetical protein